jgi:RHS repeat-associated protein
VTTVYVYDAQGVLAAEYDSPAAQPSTCGTCYLTADTLGSTRMITDETATPRECHDYLPFGEEINRSSAGGCYAATTSNTLKFTGKERDQETGNDYFGARYFGSAQERFTIPDPVAGAVTNPQSLNKYAYTWNNPLRYTDPTGMFVSWEDSKKQCRGDETGDECKTRLQREFENRITALQNSKDKKERAQGKALAATYKKLQDARETFHVVREDGSGSGELSYRGHPGDLYVEMKGGDSMYGQMPDLQKIAHEFKHGEQFLEGLIGFTNITGKWTSYRDDLVDEANAFMAGFMAEGVGPNQSTFLRGLSQAAVWGVQPVVDRLQAADSPYRLRPAQELTITSVPPSVYAIPRSE